MSSDPASWLSFLNLRAVLLCGTILLALRWLLGRPRRLPPGPWGLPLIGAVPAIVRDMLRGSRPQQLFMKYAAKYGPVFHLRILNKDVVVLNDYASVREAFQHPQLNDRPHMLLPKLFRSNGVAMTSGEPWVELRRFCLTVLRSFGVGKSSFEEQIATEAEELVKEFSALREQPFDPKKLLSVAISNVICSVIFGKRYEYDDDEFKELLALLGRSFKLIGAGGAVNFFPQLRYLPFIPTAEIVANFEAIRSFLVRVIDGHRREFDGVNTNDFTDVYLKEINNNQAKAAAGGGGTSRSHLTESNFVGTVGNLFAAGSETTATTLQWCLLYMAVHPDVQKRVQDEIDAAVGRNRLPRMADKPELNFTRAVIWEVQRLSIVVPLGVPHAAAADTPFRGFVIPKGALLMPNLWAVSRDPRVWTEPDAFRPARFLDDAGKASPADELIPFSTGRRSCIGEHLAKMELFIFFTYFMHQFTFTVPGSSTPPSLAGRGGLTNAPAPFQVCPVRRQ